jgi:hypothetical protein
VYTLTHIVIGDQKKCYSFMMKFSKTGNKLAEMPSNEKEKLHEKKKGSNRTADRLAKMEIDLLRP